MSASVVIREAAEADLPALARLHVATWNATYPDVPSPPTVALRERQWREAFAATDGSWFCFVVERQDGALVGFAKGIRYASGDQPGNAGELSKLYLLGEHQGQGLGRRLMGHVARRFLAGGITSMLVFADAGNPHRHFYEAMGGEKLREPDGGESESNYGWPDLRRLASLCPIE